MSLNECFRTLALMHLQINIYTKSPLPSISLWRFWKNQLSLKIRFPFSLLDLISLVRRTRYFPWLKTVYCSDVQTHNIVSYKAALSGDYNPYRLTRTRSILCCTVDFNVLLNLSLIRENLIDEIIYIDHSDTSWYIWSCHQVSISCFTIIIHIVVIQEIVNNQI